MIFTGGGKKGEGTGVAPNTVIPLLGYTSLVVLTSSKE